MFLGTAPQYFSPLVFRGGLPGIFRAFALTSAKLKKSAGSQRKKRAKKAKTPSAKEKKAVIRALPHHARNPVSRVRSHSAVGQRSWVRCVLIIQLFVHCFRISISTPILSPQYTVVIVHKAQRRRDRNCPLSLSCPVSAGPALSVLS